MKGAAFPSGNIHPRFDTVSTYHSGSIYHFSILKTTKNPNLCVEQGYLCFNPI